jgi:hypothetical protein
MKSVCSFLCLPKETNQRKGTRVSCPAEGGIPGVYAPHGVLLDAAEALQTRCAQTVQIPFSAASPVLGCVPMGVFPPFVLPRLADGGGKRRGNCLRAKPEFFRVPPSARSKGSPQGQDWLGCLFLVSSFGHAKEEKRTAKRSRYFLRNSRMNLKKGGVSPAFFYARIRKQMLPGLCLIPQGQDWESAC